jgi:hypothetical protein
LAIATVRIHQRKLIVLPRKAWWLFLHLRDPVVTGHDACRLSFARARDRRRTPAILDALVEGGADVIELGMPFTDPMADGPAIQLANLRSLGAGTKTADIFPARQRFPRASPKCAARADGLCQSDDDPGLGLVCR